MLISRLTLGCLTLLATLLATACTPSPSTGAAEPETTPAETAQPPTSDTPAAATTVAETTAEATLSADRTGTFASAEHETVGGVTLVSQNGKTTLMFDETFSTSQGPDLVVVLHRSATVLQETTPPAYPLQEGDYVVIAPLASTTGTQQYTIPAEVNIADFQAVAVWCQQFNATFGVAPLQ